MRLTSLLLLVLAAPVSAGETKPLSFRIALDKSMASEACSGRLFVMLSSRPNSEPRSGVNWFKPEPFFAADVKDWKHGTDRPLLASAACPEPLAKLKPGTYIVQAVLDLDRANTKQFGTSPGNLYSKPRSLQLDPSSSGEVTLILDQVAKAREFKETERVKLIDIESKLLSGFHKKPIRLRAGVVLPKSYGETKQKRYPVLYEVPGFGGSHFIALNGDPDKRTDIAGVEFLVVVLDPDCRTGHHVFADSANNGPYGQALIEELIPHIEKTFRAAGKPEGRFVTGHSSGGWSSLWLQVTYPDFFGGVWSTAPDPVDFRDFQRIGLYKPGVNMFTDEAGKPRPIARSKDKVLLWYWGFSDMEEVMGRGGQLASFEAVFSPRGTDGQPRKLWDRKTGAVNAEVAKTWEKYDIRLVLEKNWPALKPKLAGKLHVYMGSQDTFYLEGATELLQRSLKTLGSDAKVEIFAGRDHASLMDKAMRERIAREMAAQFQRSQATLAPLAPVLGGEGSKH